MHAHNFYTMDTHWKAINFYIRSLASILLTENTLLSFFDANNFMKCGLSLGWTQLDPSDREYTKGNTETGC